MDADFPGLGIWQCLLDSFPTGKPPFIRRTVRDLESHSRLFAPAEKRSLLKYDYHVLGNYGYVTYSNDAWLAMDMPLSIAWMSPAL